MPELPEVELLRLGILKYLDGQTIASVEVRTSKMVHGDLHKTVGGTIEAARRFGKMLCLDLSNGWSIAVHLKMKLHV